MTRYMRSRGYHSVMRSHRYRPILIILLVLLAAFLIFKVAGVGGINESNYEAQRNTRPVSYTHLEEPLEAVLPLLTDETFFLHLMGAHGFAPKWDARLYAALRHVCGPALLSASVSPPVEGTPCLLYTSRCV